MSLKNELWRYEEFLKFYLFYPYWEGEKLPWTILVWKKKNAECIVIYLNKSKFFSLSRKIKQINIFPKHNLKKSLQKIIN